MEPQTIKVDRLIEERDVDAALYLLSRMLGVSENPLRRQELLHLRDRLAKSRLITDVDRRDIVASYREVIG